MNNSRSQGGMPSRQEQQLPHLGGIEGDGDPLKEAPAIHETLQQQESNQQSVVPEQEATDVAIFEPNTPPSFLSMCMAHGRGLKFWKEPKKPSSKQDVQSLPSELILLILEEAAYSAPGTLHSTLRVSRFMRELSLYVIRHNLSSRVHPDHPFETYIGLKSDWDGDDDDGSNGNGSNDNGSIDNGSNDTNNDIYSDTDSDDGDVAPTPLVFVTQASIPYFFRPLDGSARVHATYEFKGDWRYGADPIHPAPGPWLGTRMRIPMVKQYIPVTRHLVASQPRDVAAWFDPKKCMLHLDWRPFVMRMVYLLWVRERKECRAEKGMLRRVGSWLGVLSDADVGNSM